MTHKIRQHIINEFGLPDVEVVKVEGKLGSGILDKNGAAFEIENNDKVISLDMINGSVEVVGHVGD